eukprot:COSAG01_NODE_10290_length_2199_cov_2.613333_3_plen_178_part_00
MSCATNTGVNNSQPLPDAEKLRTRVQRTDDAPPDCRLRSRSSTSIGHRLSSASVPSLSLFPSLVRRRRQSSAENSSSRAFICCSAAKDGDASPGLRLGLLLWSAPAAHRGVPAFAGTAAWGSALGVSGAAPSQRVPAARSTYSSAKQTPTPVPSVTAARCEAAPANIPGPPVGMRCN